MAFSLLFLLSCCGEDRVVVCLETVVAIVSTSPGGKLFLTPLLLFVVLVDQVTSPGGKLCLTPLLLFVVLVDQVALAPHRLLFLLLLFDIETFSDDRFVVRMKTFVAGVSKPLSSNIFLTLLLRFVVLR